MANYYVEKYGMEIKTDAAAPVDSLTPRSCRNQSGIWTARGLVTHAGCVIPHEASANNRSEAIYNYAMSLQGADED